MSLLDSIGKALPKVVTALGGKEGIKDLATTAVKTVANKGWSSSGASDKDKSPEDWFKDRLMDSLVEDYKKRTEEDIKKMEEALKKGDPGAVK